MNLSDNFTLQEFTYSVTANANGINNTPSKYAIANMRALCENVLQPLRNRLGCPVKVTSGFRCAVLNKLIGGSINSQHCIGLAADIVVPQKDLREVYEYIKNNLDYDQLLFEYNKNTKWIHVSYRTDGKNRKQAIDNYKVA